MEHITCPDVPTPKAPLTSAIKTPHAIYCSGQVHRTKDGVTIQGSIQKKTEQICRNLQAVLKAAGSDCSKVVKCNIYLSDMAHFAEMNEEYAKWFSHKPARSCVAVTLPQGIDVEIECTALP